MLVIFCTHRQTPRKSIAATIKVTKLKAVTKVGRKYYLLDGHTMRQIENE